MEPPGTRPGSTALTAVTEDRAAAQRRAQEIVARIRAEKAAVGAAVGATNTDTLVAASPLTAAAVAAAGALRDCSAAAADTLAAAPMTPPRLAATANASAQTPERTPQIPTPARNLRPIIDDASASTAPASEGEEISTVLARNRLTVRTMGAQLDGGAGGLAMEPLQESRAAAPQSPSSSSQPTSPAQSVQAAAALDQANAAIEAARRASAGLEGHGAVARSFESVSYNPAGGSGSGMMRSEPTSSPVTSISIGPSKSAGAASYGGGIGTTSPRSMNSELISEAERAQAERERQQLTIYKEQMELQQQQIQTQKEHIQLLQSVSSLQRERSVMSEEHATNTSSDDVLDRDQLLSELGEARKMMNSAGNAEEANFWKGIVEDLERKLQKSSATPQDPQAQQALSQSKYVALSQSRSAVLSQSRSVASNTEGPALASSSRSALKPPKYQQPMVYDGQPMVDVIAPADLPAGYTFEAQIGSKRFLATVPPGGVRGGNRFSCPLKSLDRVEIRCPTGSWRDGLFSVFKYGVFHPLVLNALCVPLIAVGQIMSRNHLTWFGDYGYRFQSMSIFTNMLVLVLFWGFLNILFLFVIGVTLNRGNLPHYFDYIALALVNVGMFVFSAFAVGKTRAAVRARYHIPPSLPACGNGSTEDYLFATFCMPCTICQMGRHTADFDRYRAVCCNGTGLPAKVDVIPEPLSAQGRLSPVLDDSHFV